MPELQDRTQTADSSRDTLLEQPAADPARLQTPNAGAVAPHAQAQAWGAPVDPMVHAPNPQGAAFAQDQQAKGLGGPAPAALPSAAPKPSSPAPSETGAAQAPDAGAQPQQQTKSPQQQAVQKPVFKPLPSSLADTVLKCASVNVADVRIAEDPSLVQQGVQGVARDGLCVAVAPGLLGDQTLCFHELAHIVQQRGGSPNATNEQSRFSSVEDEANAAANAFIKNEKFSISLQTKEKELFQNGKENASGTDTFLKKLGELDCDYKALSDLVQQLSDSKRAKYNLKQYEKMLNELKSLPPEKLDAEKINDLETLLARDQATIFEDLTSDLPGTTFEELEQCSDTPPIESDIWECSEESILQKLESDKEVRKSILAHAPLCEDRVRNAIQKIKHHCPSFDVKTIEMLDEKARPLLNIHGQSWRNHVSIIFKSQKIFDPLMIDTKHQQVFKNKSEWMLYHLDPDVYFGEVTYDNETQSVLYKNIMVRIY